MLEWTLKYNDGSEAYGVRRGRGNENVKLMDLGSEGWAKFYAWFFDQQVKNANADGVAIDEVMGNGYWGTNVDQLRDYDTVEEIKETCLEWIRIVNDNMESEVITQAFWPEVVEHQQGVWGEISFRSGGAYGGRVDMRQQNVYYETLNWKGIVENMYSVASTNKSYIWAAWYERDNLEALEYAISTYLMGKPNDFNCLTFHPQPIYDLHSIVSFIFEFSMIEISCISDTWDLESLNRMW